jgi:hypothetical protein
MMYKWKNLQSLADYFAKCAVNKREEPKNPNIKTSRANELKCEAYAWEQAAHVLRDSMFEELPKAGE